MNGNLEEVLRAALERLESLEQHLEALRRRYKSLKRRSQLALSKVKDAIAELEAADGSPHVEAGLEILYDVERLLGWWRNERGDLLSVQAVRQGVLRPRSLV